MLSAEEPGGSVNINEAVAKVSAAVSHADRRRKWYCYTSLLADALLKVSLPDTHAYIWITGGLSKNMSSLFAALVQLWKNC